MKVFDAPSAGGDRVHGTQWPVVSHLIRQGAPEHGQVPVL